MSQSPSQETVHKFQGPNKGNKENLTMQHECGEALSQVKCLRSSQLTTLLKFINSQSQCKMSSATGPKMHSDPPPKRSSFALRYYDFADGHSDLTPRPTLIPPFPSFSNTPTSRTPSNQTRDWDTIETHQRNRLHSFTTRELINLDAMTERQMAASTLCDVPVLTLLRKTQWDNTGTMFGRKEAILVDDWGQSGGEEGGMYGSWTSGNEHVWEALRPSLAIANQYLLSSHMLPWVSYS